MLKNSCRLKILCCAALIAVAPWRISYAGPLEDIGSYFTPNELNTQIARTLQDSGRAVQKIVKDYESVVLFYEGRKFEPYWTASSGLNSKGQEFLSQIEESWSHGLNPYRYHLRQISELSKNGDKQSLADLELLLTDAYIRIGGDLSGIRVEPSAMNTRKSFWQAPLNPRYLLERLEAASDIEGLIESIAPSGQTYQRLRKELISLIDEKEPMYEAALPIRLQGQLHPYQRSAATPALRYRLGLPESQDSQLYDDKTAAAVIRFQKENGLKADGIVGGLTLEILNITRKQKIEQLIANLERLRWVDENKPDKFVVVNIPSATLWAVEEGRLAFDMPVIVGRSERPTNTFIANITGVRFNPDWTVPPTIKKEDIVPKLQKDPQYLAQKGMQLIQGTGAQALSVDPESVDWANITAKELAQYRMVQIPGAHNPLGRVRVLMPNDYNIYLHDTNEPAKFNRAGRAASSGCVRMSEPEKMASFIMKEREGWSEAQMEALFADGKTHDMSIPQSIPVYMLYYTVWIDQEGRIVYGNDLYGYDKKLIEMLRNIDGIFIPMDNTESRNG